MGEARVPKGKEIEIPDGFRESWDCRLAGYHSLFVSDLVDFLFPQKYDVGLDVAGGTGTAGLKLAERIGPEGSVTTVDISPVMIRRAQENAAIRKLNNLRAQIMDAERLEFADNSFDIITCSFGVMSFPNVARAISEAHRVLKPGGRIGFLVWSHPERFPFFSEPMAAFMKRAAPAPLPLLLKIPRVGSRILQRVLVTRGPLGFSPCRFSKEGSLEKYLGAAGLHSIRRLHCSYSLEFENFDEYWHSTREICCPGSARKAVSEKLLEQVREELRKRLVQPKTGEVQFRNEAAIVLARKPS